MGSDLFQVKVLAKKGTNVSLHVVSVHPDSGAPPANESFAIQLLEEASDEGAFAAAVSFDDTMDSAWQTKFARGFISSVKATARKAGNRPSATLEISVTHPAWIAHLERGETWDSRAFAIVGKFSACKPIAPEVGETLVDGGADDDFWILVPRSSWEGMDLAPSPDLMVVPAYAPTSYAVKDLMKKPRAIPKDWIGRAVRVATGSRTQDCVLLAVEAGGRGKWARMTDSGYGTGSGPVDSIALLVPKSGRQGSKMTYRRLLGRAKAQFAGSKRNGKVIELRYRIAPDLRTLNLDRSSPTRRKCCALDALRSGLVDEDGVLTKPGAATALGKSLTDTAKRHGIEGGELDEKIVDDYIEKVELDVAEGHDLDAMSLGEVRAILEAEWPIATLRITATDAKWLAHLDKFPPAAMHTEDVEPTRKVKAKPAAKPKPKPAAKAKPKLAAKVKAKPAAKVKPKPAAKVKPKPAAKVKPKPAAKAKPKPAAKAKPKPAAKAKPKPAAKAKPKPAAKPK
jgi:hypothetical protein